MKKPLGSKRGSPVKKTQWVSYQIEYDNRHIHVSCYACNNYSEKCKPFTKQAISIYNIGKIV